MQTNNKGQARSKHDHIIEIASALFNEFGFVGVGVDRIIAESAVAKMTLYRHFPGKKDIILASIEREILSMQSQIRQRVESKKSLISKIKSVFDWHNEWFQRDTFHGCICIRANFELGAVDDDIRQAAALRKSYTMKLLNDILRNGGVSITASRKLSKTLSFLLDGALVAAQVMGDRASARHAWDAAVPVLAEYNIS